MPTTLRFRTSPSASSLWAAWCCWRNTRLLDAQLAEAIAAPADELHAAIVAAGWTVEPVLLELLNLAVDVDNNRALAEQAARRVVGPQPAQSLAITRLSGAIADLERAFAQCRPTQRDELLVRSRPLREQIEARIPGMLQHLGRITDPQLIPESAECVLVYPAAGGGGMAHPRTNRIIQEAVLVNPLPELPEAVRAAWLIAQLNLDLPKFAEGLPTGGLRRVGPLAMIPPTLAAAEQVELARLDRSTLAHALDAWRLPVDDGEQVARALDDWWVTYFNANPAWSVAMAALAQMLPPSGS